MTDTQRSTNSSTKTGPNPGAQPKIQPKATPVDVARKAIEDGAEAVRTQATAAYEASAQAVDNAPLTALAGAIALGAVAAALIPNSSRELQALGPIGNRVRGALDDAFAAAKVAGAEQLTARGLTAAATSTGAGALLGSIVKAVLAANGAAKDALHADDATADAKTENEPVSSQQS